MSCCPLTSGTMVVTVRQRTTSTDATVTRDLHSGVVATDVVSMEFAIPLRLPDQNRTYLRGCVFLI
jgi:hypothetical protein